MIKNLIGAFVMICCVFASTLGFAQDQKTIDDAILTKYFEKNKIKATRTASGLYYVITKKGTGANAQAGKMVNMNYYGKFLDGKKFDSNVDENWTSLRPPLQFTLGQHMVITGWDQGIELLNPGTKATLYIPSHLAYGPSGRGPIPPNTILVFDVELVSVGN